MMAFSHYGVEAQCQALLWCWAEKLGVKTISEKEFLELIK